MQSLCVLLVCENQDPPLRLFDTRLTDFIDLKHPLVVISEKIDWAHFDAELGALFTHTGRPALPTRLMVGLSYLKHAFNVSDERLVELFLENPYWQSFCGFEYFQTKFPCEPSSLVRWRKRIGEAGCAQLLQETLRMATTEKLIRPKDLKEVTVDTTVQEKNIAYPTDGKLLYRAIVKLVSAAKKSGIVLRQSYSRVAKKTAFAYAMYTRAKQFKRARRMISKLKTFIGRLVREVRRKGSHLGEKIEELLGLAERLRVQKREDSNKLYSLHEPHVECISKGKAHKKYEFGCKSSWVTTAFGTWILGMKSFHGNPYDGATLQSILEDVEKNTAVKVERVFVDKGYRGEKHWPKEASVLVSGRKNLPKRLRKLLRRRSAIEPVLGHLKADHRLRRNFLKGVLGDHQNALLAAAAFNFRKLLRHFWLLFVFLWAGLMGQRTSKKMKSPFFDASFCQAA